MSKKTKVPSTKKVLLIVLGGSIIIILCYLLLGLLLSLPFILFYSVIGNAG